MDKITETDTVPDAVGTGEMVIGFLLLTVLVGAACWHYFDWFAGTIGAGVTCGLTFVVMGWIRRTEWLAILVASVGARALDGTLSEGDE
jgi:hypothetical protein